MHEGATTNQPKTYPLYEMVVGKNRVMRYMPFEMATAMLNSLGVHVDYGDGVKVNRHRSRLMTEHDRAEISAQAMDPLY
jgi:hypothetical protein